MGNGEWGMGNGNGECKVFPRSLLPIPHSLLPTPHSPLPTYPAATAASTAAFICGTLMGALKPTK